METIEAILSRRSIRKFTDGPVSDALIEKLLQGGMCAPSAHNEQPWHFIVIKERAILDEISKIHPYAQMLKEAPVGICVCADMELEKDKGVGYWIQDCSAATENILIGARGLGLGACWLGIHPRTERKQAVKKLLRLPDHVEPFCVIALGQPAEEKPPANRFKSNRIHQNTW